MALQPFTGRSIGLSAALPELPQLERAGASELDLRLLLARLTEYLIHSGYRVATLAGRRFVAPIIERVARAMGPLPIRRSGESGSSFMASLVLYTPTSHFPGTAGTDFEQRHGDYAEIRWMGGQNTPPPQALRLAREEMFGSVDAVICIAGVGAPEDWRFPDVDEELHLALTRQRPTFCIGGFGGFVRDWFDPDPPGRTRFLNNGLGEENVTLATSQSPADLLRLLSKGLRLLES